jgi:hypothetical protein
METIMFFYAKPGMALHVPVPYTTRRRPGSGDGPPWRVCASLRRVAGH